MWQQRKRSTLRFSTAADQEEKDSSDWAVMPRCSAYYAPVTNALEVSLRRTRRECGKIYDSSRGILELAAARKGTSPSPQWSFPNFAKGHRDGRRSPGLTSHRMARGEAAALESAKKQLMTPIGMATPWVKSEHLSDDDDSLQRQIRAAVKQALQVRHRRAKAQRPMTVDETETGSRSS